MACSLHGKGWEWHMSMRNSLLQSRPAPCPGSIRCSTRWCLIGERISSRIIADTAPGALKDSADTPQ